MNQQAPLKIGIVGTGVMGEYYSRIMSKDPRAQVVAIASGDVANARRVASGIPGADACEDWNSLVERPDLSVVIVATPDYLHRDIAIMAARAGKDLLIEKPLAMKAEDAVEIVAAVRMAGVLAMTLFNNRWIPAFAQAAERIARGELGDPVMAYARMNDRIDVPTKVIRWAERTTPAWFLESHDIDLVSWLIGSAPTEVAASAVKRKLVSQGIDTPDAILAHVRYANGAVATFESCWIYPETFPTMVDAYVEVVGTEGVIHVDQKRDTLEVATAGTFEFPSGTLVREVHGVPAGSVVDCVSHFLDCALSRSEPLISIESSAHVSMVLDAMHNAIASGRFEPIRPAPQTHPHH